MKILTIKIPEELDAQIRALASAREISASEVVREAAEQYLASHPEAVPGSFLELTRDLFDVFEGPADLSVNKAHKKDYGK
ncbi:MAG TPA: CopG family transcriptional regulator [Acidobacteriota bacterium]|nr:CopG family transcriptional regulator [Acidobacteriota bacterium]